MDELCHICGIKKATYWDHDYETGLVRGHLCPTCNRDMALVDRPQQLDRCLAYKASSALGTTYSEVRNARRWMKPERKEYMKAWHDKPENREKDRERSLAYYYANKERIKQRLRDKYANDPEFRQTVNKNNKARYQRKKGA